ncbi:MAG TPA: F0F1 ATP synthase subunit A [Oligoflexia bacterium]|nr:F0F1 ATP synthase subunit A [Oligoflexia bacterium]
MHGEHSFTWISLIPGLEHAPNHVVMTVIVAILAVVMGGIATMQLNAAGGAIIVPESKLTFRNFFDLVAEKLYGFCETTLGEHEAKTYFPVIGTLFIFIFFSNLFGLIPGFLPSTDNINTTLAVGLFVFIFYNIQGFKANGVGYLKHFLGPVWYLAPLMLVIEIVSHVFRPLSLALRLRGNIQGDHVVLGVMSSLVPYLVPVIFMLLGLFVAFVQAFVFCLLTMVYISLSTAHDH